MTKRNQGEGRVDLNLGNACSATAFAWAKKTFANREGQLGAPMPGPDKAFSTLLDFNGLKIAVSSDGIGTKIEVAERTGRYDTLGHDLGAMVVDDLVAIGAQPVGLSNILDVDVLDHEIIDALMKGLHNAAGIAGVVVTGGEIASLGDRIRGWGERMHFNWCATGIGVLPPGADPVDGSHISPQDVVISLASRGLRSNGFTLARNILKQSFGKAWHEAPYEGETPWGEVLLTPSLIFAPAVSRLIASGITIHGVVHITGGGIPDNLARVLAPNALGAVLDRLFPPHPAMRRLQGLGKIAEEVGYRQWNMGNGMLLVVPDYEVKRCLANLEAAGYCAQVAGRITQRPGITICSGGCNPQRLAYAVPERSSRGGEEG